MSPTQTSWSEARAETGLQITNSVIGRIRRNANGFHNPKAFITMIMLDRGSLAPDLPWTKP